MKRLYLRIYLTVLGSLFVFALLAAMAAGVLSVVDDDAPWSPWPDAGAKIVERLLSAKREPASLAEELAFWRDRTGFALMLRAPDGRVIAKAGDFPARIDDEIEYYEDRRLWRGWRGLYGLTLDDGRQLIAKAPKRPRAWARHFIWLPALLGIALAVGIAAFPLIRYLTRRLERLEAGVAAFGEGDLSARVAISGKDEIARLAATFNASADRIEALLMAHKTLLANASHELRSPLSRLRMAVEGGAAAGDETQRRAEIKRNIGELDALVEEILLASRLQANGVGELKREPVDLAGLIAEECAAYGADFAVADGQTPVIQGDARLLRRLLRNLLENAARYGGGAADVSLATTGGEARIAVADRGPGVPDAEREKIFEPFYRLRNMPESAGGAGLGLALVKQIAERHGGRVGVASRDGGGARFEVTLPLRHSSSPRT
jgi:signal transduction histidine kinase